jgi:cytochrome c553
MICDKLTQIKSLLRNLVILGLDEKPEWRGFSELAINQRQPPMKKIIKSLAIAMIFSMVSATGWAVGSAAVKSISQTERSMLSPSRDLVELGRGAAEANCAGCHGMDGISDQEGTPHLAGQRAVYLYRVLRAFQSGDRPDEQGNHNKFLSDQALHSTAVFYSQLPPVIITANTEAAKSGGETDEAVDDPFLSIRSSMRKCIKCHGETGNSKRAGMPSLTAQDPEYFVTSMMAYIDGSRNHRLMGKLVSELDEATIRAMGVFYAVQDPLQTENPGEGDVNVGKRLSQKCAGCHGDDGNALKASMPSLAGQDAKYFIKGMNHYKDGERQHEKMFEASEQLSEQDMVNLATFYASQKPVRRNVRMPLNSTEWITRCERCHGLDGNSGDPRFPMLAGQDETYLVKMLKAYASGMNENRTMHAMADPVSAINIERIAAHFASEQPKAAIYLQLPCEGDQ